MSTVTVEKTCPACNGTGGEGAFKNWVEGKGGGVCSTCHGSGKVIEKIHIRDDSSSSNEMYPVGCTPLVLIIIILVFVPEYWPWILLLAPLSALLFWSEFK